ncbi:hypothetical protein QJS10_CPB12g01412 [Acorus calamus]|uniref:AT-hook motif nuclear-localized protein n=1 Tax=Acorus calamus TaxID=4465 RepID=A0AAV9DPD1_ACOCL|nr:hypothetical protein QJS10_CPB12g01412 [Acorus calamus]
MRSESEERQTRLAFTDLHHHHHHHHHIQPPSDEVNSSSSIQPSRRPRGRPPGSKNRPKPPSPSTHPPNPHPHPPLLPHVLHIPSGADLSHSLTTFSLRRNLGLSVLSASGALSNVTLRSGGGAVAFHGRFEILSLSASFFPPSFNLPSAASSASVSLAGPQGQVVGGNVAGPLTAAGTVVVVAAAFGSPSYHRLPLAAEEEEEMASAEASDHEAAAAAVEESDQSHHRQQREESIYGCHVASDIVWVPTARQPPTHHY